MLGEATVAARSLGHTFSHAMAGFIVTGRPAADQWHPYEAADPSTIRHFA